MVHLEQENKLQEWPLQEHGDVFSLGVTLTRNAHTVRMLIMTTEEKGEAYMLGELRNKMRSVYTERLFSIRIQPCSKQTFLSRGQQKRNVTEAPVGKALCLSQIDSAKVEISSTTLCCAKRGALSV